MLTVGIWITWALELLTRPLGHVHHAIANAHIALWNQRADLSDPTPGGDNNEH